MIALYAGYLGLIVLALCCFAVAIGIGDENE